MRWPDLALKSGAPGCRCRPRTEAGGSADTRTAPPFSRPCEVHRRGNTPVRPQIAAPMYKRAYQARHLTTTAKGVERRRNRNSIPRPNVTTMTPHTLGIFVRVAAPGRSQRPAGLSQRDNGTQNAASDDRRRHGVARQVLELLLRLDRRNDSVNPNALQREALKPEHGRPCDVRNGRPLGVKHGARLYCDGARSTPCRFRPSAMQSSVSSTRHGRVATCPIHESSRGRATPRQSMHVYGWPTSPCRSRKSACRSSYMSASCSRPGLVSSRRSSAKRACRSRSSYGYSRKPLRFGYMWASGLHMAWVLCDVNEALLEDLKEYDQQIYGDA